MVNLEYFTPLYLIANGIRYSHNNRNKTDSLPNFIKHPTCPMCGSDEYNLDKETFSCGMCTYVTTINNHIGKKDFDLIKRVGFKFKHESVLEHSLLTFDIECSRALLQELARHRLQSLTVKSSRYVLSKELKDERVFSNISDYDKSDNLKRIEKYLILTNDIEVDNMSIKALSNLQDLIKLNKSNDIAKYSLPESLKTSLQLSLNLRSLLNLLELRLSKDALWEFRQLAYELINELPEDYRELIFENQKIKKDYELYKRKLND